jgi:hypothetical protein
MNWSKSMRIRMELRSSSGARRERGDEGFMLNGFKRRGDFPRRGIGGV